MKIGSKLLLLRHQYSFSQEYVADKLNISQSTYSRIESDISPQE
jgi:transcriptional regulator with XRE-family HTH domain